MDALPKRANYFLSYIPTISMMPAHRAESYPEGDSCQNFPFLIYDIMSRLSK
jgi:hypothetical protein